MKPRVSGPVGGELDSSTLAARLFELVDNIVRLRQFIHAPLSRVGVRATARAWSARRWRQRASKKFKRFVRMMCRLERLLKYQRVVDDRAARCWSVKKSLSRSAAVSIRRIDCSRVLRIIGGSSLVEKKKARPFALMISPPPPTPPVPKGCPAYLILSPPVPDLPPLPPCPLNDPKQ